MIKRTLVFLLLVQTVWLWGQTNPEAKVIDSFLNPDFEYSMPLESPDGERLYYLRTAISASMKQKGLGQEIWYSEKVEGKWSQPQHLFHFLPDQGNNALVGISANQETFYIFNSQNSHRTLARGIAKTSQDSLGEWKDFELLDIPGLKIDDGIFSFYVHPKGELVIISMQNKDKESADNDLYFSQRAQNGIWSPVKVLGNNINSDGFEGTPFLSADSKTLYFASNGHEGAENMDIFKSQRLENNWEKWSMAERLPAPYNSADFDAYFSLGKEKAYWVSNREHKNSQVYSERYVPEEKLLAKNETSKEDSVSASKNENAENKGNRHQISSSKNEMTDLPIDLKQPEVQTTMLYFDFNKRNLTAEHRKKLTAIIDKIDRKKLLSIKGYTDNIGSKANNLKVAKWRAQAVEEFLLEKGIRSEVMLVKALGEKKPIASNKSEEGRSKNRRVEIEWIENTQTTQR